jgi:hypothetical protein
MAPSKIEVLADGGLLLLGGAHHVADLFLGNIIPPSSALFSFNQNIMNRIEFCRSREIQYQHYVFPDPLVVATQAGISSKKYESTYIKYFQDKKTADIIVYPIHNLIKSRGMMLKTDTHYSPVANAHIAAEVARQIANINTDQILSEALSDFVEEEYCGDLGVQCEPKQFEIVRRLRKINGLSWETNGLSAGNSGIIDLAISPESATSRKLLIFGDSFFRGMLTELSRYWREIVFLRTPYFHTDFVNSFGPDDIITGMAERYLDSVKLDSSAPNFLALPLMSGRPTNPSSNFGTIFSKLIDARKLNVLVKDSSADIVYWPDEIQGSNIEEQLAFSFWFVREGRKSGRAGKALSEIWSSSRDAYRKEAEETLIVMRRRGLWVGV